MSTETVLGTSGDNAISFLGTTGGHRAEGRAGRDTLTGGSAADTLFGGTGNDRLVGSGGADRLDGGGNADRLEGDGSDDLYITDGLDTIIEAAGGGTDTVQSAVSFTLGLNLENLTLAGAAVSGTGNTGVNRITGNAAKNTLNGGGGAGNDTYITDGGDTITDTAGTDTVQSSASFTLGATLENLTLTGTAKINGTGNALANTIIGNSGKNALNGGLGNDILTGGAGKDSFVFTTTPGPLNFDTITDFSVPADTIRLLGSIFTDIGIGRLSKAEFRANNSGNAQDASDRVIYDKDNGNLFWDKDGKGGAAKVLFADLAAGLNINHKDFFVF